MKDRMKLSTESRRNFVKAGAAVGAGLLIVPSGIAFGSAANSSLGLGIIGCGERGNYDGGEFVNNTDVRVTALHDLFDDRLEQTRAHFDKLGRSLTSSVKAYNSAVATLESRVMVSARRFRDLELTDEDLPQLDPLGENTVTRRQDCPAAPLALTPDGLDTTVCEPDPSKIGRAHV